MRYMLLIYADEHAWPYDERAVCYEESTRLTHQLERAGQYIDAAPLQPVSMATTVRIRDGKRLITDGPFAETREQFGGYFLIEAANLDDAIDIAGRLPAVTRGTVEIRPVLELPGLPKKTLSGVDLRRAGSTP